MTTSTQKDEVPLYLRQRNKTTPIPTDSLSEKSDFTNFHERNLENGFELREDGLHSPTTRRCHKSRPEKAVKEWQSETFQYCNERQERDDVGIDVMCIKIRSGGKIVAFWGSPQINPRCCVENGSHTTPCYVTHWSQEVDWEMSPSSEGKQQL